MLISGLVIAHQGAVHRLGDMFRLDGRHTRRVGNTRRCLHRGESLPCISTSESNNVILSLLTQGELRSQTAVVCHRPLHHLANILGIEWCESHHERSTEQGCDDGERGIFGRRSDEDDKSVLHTGQKCVLLCFRETMYFVEKKDRGTAGQLALDPGVIHDVSHIFHAGCDRGQLNKLATRRPGDNTRQCCFARSRWTPQDDGRSRPLAIRVGE